MYLSRKRGSGGTKQSARALDEESEQGEIEGSPPTLIVDPNILSIEYFKLTS
jgi:hypothetical protein